MPAARRCGEGGVGGTLHAKSVNSVEHLLFSYDSDAADAVNDVNVLQEQAYTD